MASYHHAFVHQEMRVLVGSTPHKPYCLIYRAAAFAVANVNQGFLCKQFVIKQEIRCSSRGLESLTSVLEEEVSYCTWDRATFELSRCDKPFSSKTVILVPTKKRPLHPEPLVVALGQRHLGASLCYQISWLTPLMGLVLG